VGATIRLFLCGDVMTGRGIDQILPHPAPDHLHEPHMDRASGYVRLAEARHGALPRGVGWDYVWGDALAEFAAMRPTLRVINLETAVTLSEDADSKGINYRMNPANLPVLTTGGVDVATLANNHVLDWGRRGLSETLSSLVAAGITPCGAGHDDADAAQPAVFARAAGGRVLVFACAHGSSGVPRSWAAGPGRPGVHRLPDLSSATADRLAAWIGEIRRPGDVVVLSIHWGGNWGFEVPGEQRAFARRLIDRGGVAIVHGHSSHHAKAFERHGPGLICYGAGDFLTDYEGITSTRGHRDDLVLMIWPDIDPESGAVTACTLTPMQLRRLRLTHPSGRDRQWLRETLARECAAFDTRVREDTAGRFQLEPMGG
jgi:poly-gamma-glutamate synthesis protein (capsule biosynthesis protein)